MLSILLMSFLLGCSEADLSIKPNIDTAGASVYVSTAGNDNTAVPGNNNKPFSTIDAAISALSASGGTVIIGPGVFSAPQRGSMKSHLVLMGSGKPEPDWKITHDKATGTISFTTPQKLIGGTVLQGTLDCSLLDHIVIKDLGVDVGALWCRENNNGNAAEGLIFAQKYNLKRGLSSADGIHELQLLSPPRHGILVENVSALCRDAKALVHAMLFENLYCPQLSNLSTYFGTHGIVLKTQGGQLNNMDAHGHFNNGLILKSNDYAFGRAIAVSNVYVSSIEADDGGGIRLVGENDTLKHITITNFVTERTRFGITNNGFVDGAILSNGQLLDCYDYSIAIDAKLTHLVLSNIIQLRQGSTTVLPAHSPDNIVR